MIDERLRTVIADVLRIERDRVSPDLSIGSIPAWDSLAHLKLILAVEEAFGVRFNSADMGMLTTVKRIEEKLFELRGGSN